MNSSLHLSNKLKECGKFFSHFTMDPDEECAAAILIVLLKKQRKRKRKRLRAVWVKPLLTSRNKLGLDITLLQECWLER